MIADNNWIIPNEQESVKSRVARFRSMIRDIKRGGSAEGEEDVLKPLPRRRPSSSSAIAGMGLGTGAGISSPKKPSPPVIERMGSKTGAYDPRQKVEHTTETGELLPGNALAYCHISLSQFKGNTVKRLDVGIPLTYTIKHIPLATTVPMLKVMIHDAELN